MSTEGSCEEIRPLLPELALGVAEGDERAGALEHLAGCPDCRRGLGELSEVADELLLLAPTEEPPAGFETRLLAEFQPRREPSRRSRLRILVPVASAALAVAVTLIFAYRGDREVASHYRSTLAEVEGKYLAGARLYGPGETEVGKVYGYEGKPSWVLVTVDESSGPSVPDGSYALQVVTGDGGRIDLRRLAVKDGSGSAGGAIPIDFGDVAEVRLVGDTPGAVYGARFSDD